MKFLSRCFLVINLLVIFYNQKSVAQSNLNHSIYLELGGSGGLYSLNYDLIGININGFKIGARLGLEFLSEGRQGTTVDVYIPFTVNFMYAFGNKHHIELGVGPQIGSYEIKNVITATDIGLIRKTEVLGNATFGYRFQNPDGGFMFRVFYSPFFYQEGVQFRYEHWAGVSIGYTFKKKGE